MPRVSVALPCHNAARSLPAALESLLAQTLADFEIIAVDDGSADIDGGQTWDVLCAYARRDARLRPLRLPHQGVALAFNAAVAACTTPYIARMDADDLCLPRRLEAQAAMLDADPGLDLVSGLVRFGGDRKARLGYALHVDWLNSLATPEAMSLNRFVESPLANPSVMFRRSAWERFGPARPNTGSRLGGSRLGGPQLVGHSGPFPEDYEQWLRWLSLGARMAKADEEVLIWNDPPTRLSRTAEAYSPQAFARIKAGYAWDWLAANNPQHPRVWVWGAGRVSRQRLAPLAALGLTIQAYVDIDPNKVGQSVQGIPVLGREAVPPCPPASTAAPFLLVNVGSRGAREEITEWLAGRGYGMGEKALAVG